MKCLPRGAYQGKILDYDEVESGMLVDCCDKNLLSMKFCKAWPQVQPCQPWNSTTSHIQIDERHTISVAEWPDVTQLNFGAISCTAAPLCPALDDSKHWSTEMCIAVCEHGSLLPAKSMLCEEVAFGT